MKRRTWLRTAAATFGASLTLSNRHSRAADEPEPPDGPDDDYSPYPPAHPRIVPIAVLDGGGLKLHAVALSSDGSRVVATHGLRVKAFRVWDAADGRERVTSQDLVGPIQALAFTPDGAQILTASSKGFAGPGDAGDPATIETWEASAKRGPQEFRSPRGRVLGLAATREGAVVALDSNDVVKCWGVAEGAGAFTLEGPKNCVRGVGFSSVQSGFGVSADGRRAVSLDICAATKGVEHPENHIVLWDADAGTRRVLDAKVDALRSVAISPDGSNVLMASTNQKIKSFEFGTGLTRFDFFPGPNLGGEGPFFLTYNPDGTRFILGMKDGGLRMYESRKGKFQIADKTRGPRTYIRAVAFLEDRLRVVSGGILEVGVVKWPNGARTWKHEPLWVWDVMLKRFPDGTEQFRQPR